MSTFDVNLDTFEPSRKRAQKPKIVIVVKGEGSKRKPRPVVEDVEEEEDDDEEEEEEVQEVAPPPVKSRRAKVPPPAVVPQPAENDAEFDEKPKRGGGGYMIVSRPDIGKQVYQVVASPAGADMTTPHRQDTSGSSSSGTVWALSENCWATCYHVVSDSAQIKIIFEGEPHSAFVVAVDPDFDLALVYCEKGGVPMSIAPESEKLESGDAIVGHGFPLGHPNLKQTTGTMSGMWGYMYQTSVPSNPGSSGGPLVSPRTNNVVAITTSGIPNASNVAFGLPAFYVRRFISNVMSKLSKDPKMRFESKWAKFNPKLLDKLAAKAASKGEDARAIVADFALFDVQFQQAGVSDLKARNIDRTLYKSGVIVHTVIPGCAFDTAGVKSGDMLLEVNGSPLDSRGEMSSKSPYVILDQARMRVDQYVNSHLPGDKLTITFNPLGQKGVVLKKPCVLVSSASLATRPVCWLAERVDYEIFAGIIFENMSYSLKDAEINIFPQSDVFGAMMFKSWNTPSLVVVNVLAGSFARCKRAIMPGDIITSVNGVAVNNLDGFRKAVMDSIKKKSPVFEIVTKHPKYVTIESRTILDQENKLSKQNGYVPGPLFESLKAAFQGVERSSDPVEDCARP